ncbi:hypothetical protein MC7420_216 [Coleofasciculus chthonoplastes PCC 7420]|uniref:Uncharacterized protein n=1 Tax=Coleofasciculus chthonoplastes PCC 7420 TaxID=118168 RepID=B4VLM5_9CYAN|nr:hypothetical protein [Coleofasciculus chthonoplastes]EDX77079.1 hypothetical protein MC7420_216 [Coleofasciculus chthonoplastes PCC 7420]
MTQRLKSWESPRRQGRNDKGKGGSARSRQLKKQRQMLRKKLRESGKAKQQNQQGGREKDTLPSFFGFVVALSYQVRLIR